jgi:hypothetical protein
VQIDKLHALREGDQMSYEGKSSGELLGKFPFDNKNKGKTLAP